MSLPVFWTKTAQEDFKNLLTIIEKDTGSDSARTFLDKTETVIAEIIESPASFPNFEHDTRFRIATLSDETSVIFQFARVNLRLLYFWDSRKGNDV